MNTSVWITGDQCSMRNTALLAANKQNAVVLMIESVERGRKIKYHKKKLLLIYSIMRHFAQELLEDGWQLDYYKESPSFSQALNQHLSKYSPKRLLMMQQSEYGADQYLRSMLPKDLSVSISPHCNFISNAEEFERLHKTEDSRVTMETFYRHMRRKTSILMDGKNPVGGIWNFDKENRQAPARDLKTAAPLQFQPDKITRDVIEMVNTHFADHPGNTDGWLYAVNRKDALAAALDFFDKRLDGFGPHQDAMITGNPFLNHSVLSPYINTCLLHPLELAFEAEKRYMSGQARLASVEGFIRQLIGWREFVWQVYWRMMPEYKSRNHFDCHNPLPEFFWTGKTKMHCLSEAISSSIEHGYAHHIIRLMILGNFALIGGLDPIETNDWFSSIYVDAYDWVMVPNVIGMTLHADGGYLGTKPYAASANYINKMSDYCKNCSFDYSKATGPNACPFNSLYWDFLHRNRERLAKNNRMTLIMKGLSAKADEEIMNLHLKAEEMQKLRFDL